MNDFQKFMASLPNSEEMLGEMKNESTTDSPAETDQADSTQEDKKEVPEIAPREAKKWEKMRKELAEAKNQLAELAELKESLKNSKTEDASIPTEWLQMMGDDDKSKQAWEMQKRLMQQMKQEIQEEVAGRFSKEKELERKAEAEADEFIESQLEALEEASGVDLSDSSRDRKAFLELVEKLSPKDGNGTITDYVDFTHAFEIYQSIKSKPNASAKKQLAARSMAKSNESITQDEAYEKGMGFAGVMQKLGL